MKTKFHLLIFLLLFTNLYSIDPNLKVYTVEDGMPTHIVYDAAQDKDGYMWFATDKGLMKYDGVEWELDTLFSQKYPDAGISFLKRDKNRNLWAFSNYNSGHIYHQVKGTWKTYNINPTTSEATIFSVDISLNRNDTLIILANANSKFFFHNSKENSDYIEMNFQDISINNVKFLDSNKVLLAANEGIFKYEIETNNFLRIAPEFLTDVNDVILDKANGKYYFITNEDFGYTDGKSYKILARNFQFMPSTILKMVTFLNHDKLGTFYFGSIYNTYRYSINSEKLTRITTENGFATNSATGIFQDDEQNIWLTSFRGVNKIKVSPFRTLSAINGLLANEVTSIKSLSDTKIILGHNTGFTFIQNNELYTLNLSQSKLHPSYQRILRMQSSDNSGLVWFISQYGGFGSIDKSGNINWKYKPKTREFPIIDFFINDSDTLLLSNPAIEKFNNGKLINLANYKYFFPRQTIQYNDSSVISAGKNGLVQMNFMTGEYTFYTTEDSKLNNCYSLSKFYSGWLIGTDNGLAFFDGETISRFKRLSINYPIYFIEKENEYFWFGLMGGAIRWNPKTNEYYHFTSKDGMIGEETNRDAFLYKDSLVYIGTDKGLSVFDPELHNFIDYDVKPKLQILSMQDSESNDYDVNVSQQIPYLNNTLALQYRGLSFRNENSLQYKIFIESLDDDTTEIFTTAGTEYFIRNLNPGKYKIGVQVINDRGVESDIHYTSEIKILAPFYLETWFLGLLVVLGFGISISIYDYINKSRHSRVLEKKVKLRTVQLKKSEENIRDLTQKLISAQESERQRISRELHDNVSQDLAILTMELEKYERAAKEVDKRKLNWLADKLVNMSKYIKNFTLFMHPSLIKQAGFVNAIQALCNDFNEYSDTRIEFYSQVNSTLHLNEDEQTNLYRLVQEALNNIRKHANAESAIVILSNTDDTLKFRIEDDGIGFNIEEVQKNKSSKSIGLRSMQERVLIAGGELKIKSSIGEGTKIFAAIPLNKTPHSVSEINSSQTSG